MLGQSELLDEEEEILLLENLASEDAVRAQFARGFIIGRVRNRGRQWSESKLAGMPETWSSAQKAEFLSCLPCDERTWDLVESMSPEVEQRYWAIVNPYWIRGTGYLERAARKFLEHGRPYTAVEFISFRNRSEEIPSPSLIADILEHALQTSSEGDLLLRSSFSRRVSELLDILEASGEIDESRIAKLEWALLPLFGRRERAPKLLHRELAQDPGFFAEAVGLVYRAEDEEPRETSEEERTRARNGYELLHSWRTVPGTADDGTINADMLGKWMQDVRAALAMSGRGVIGDQVIGQVLSGSPSGDDDIWPHPVVRDVIEDVASIELERGMEIGLYNAEE